MFYKFSKTLFDSLISNDFHVLNSEMLQKPFNDKTELIALEKSSGSNLYIVFIHNTLHYEINYVIEELAKINAFFHNIAHLKKYKQIIILNILPTNTDASEPMLENFLKIPSNIPDAFIYNVFWHVNLQKNIITVGKNQPSKILGIEKLINEIVLNIDKSTIQPSGKNIFDEYKDTVITHMNQNTVNLSPPYVTFGLILFMFTILIYTTFINPQAVYELSINSNDILLNKQYYRLFLATFVHSSVLHYIGNALGLYIFGTRVERFFGKANMFLTFFIGAFVGNVLTLILSTNPNMHSVGSSGGIFSLLGFAVCATFFLKKSLWGLDFDTLAIMFIFMLFSTFTFPNVNYISHIVGFIVGAILALSYVQIEIAHKKKL